jgi:aqualysin 1
MKGIRIRSVTIVLAALMILLPAVVGSAQKTVAQFPVIVVFDEKAALGDFMSHYRFDERMAANPDAWNYLDAGVVGAVQSMEDGLGFRADNVYSFALRGFAARLTAEQIKQLENNPLISYVEEDVTMSIQQQTLPYGINRVDADISSTLAGNGSGSVTNVRVFVIDTGVGVVPGAPVTGVKVLGCGGSGSTSRIIQGIDWVTANAVRPAVANMSLGGGVSTSLDNAVRNSANSGIFYALAAGNNGGNACNTSPARAGAGTNNGIMTTAATSSTNQEASFSNFGSCVDIWAPGVGVISTRLGGGTTSLSGTSMASPHVAGCGALVLSSNPGASPASVESTLKSQSLNFGTFSKDGRSIRIVNVRNF